MSENTIKTYSDPPYNDDFHSIDPATGKTPEEKNYLRILYKPGVSVQSRELNQMQSVIQSQIDKFGQGVFSDGASVIDGEKNFEDDIYAIDVEFDTAPGSAIDNLIMIKNGAGSIDSTPAQSVLEASIMKADPIGTSDTEYRLFIRYENSVQDNDNENIREFSNDDVIYALEDFGTIAEANGRIGKITSIKYAALAKVESGVFFVKGEFVLCDEQEIYMIKPNRDYLISGKVVLEVIESVKSSGSDPTLLDNAAGTPNFNAPGADRYAIELDLAFISDDATVAGTQTGDDYTFINDNSSVVIGKNNDIIAQGSFSEILTIVHNNIQEKSKTIFSDNIESTLARRTSEESGDYAVNPFVIDIREYLNDTTDSENRGLFTSDQIKTFGIEVEVGDISGVAPDSNTNIDPSSSDTMVHDYGKSRFVIGIEPSVAYVEGFRIAPESRVDVPVPKARTTDNNVEVYTTARLGNYLECDGFTGGLPNLGETLTIGNITSKIRGLELVGGKYRLYLYDLSGPIDPTATTGTATSGFSITFTAAVGLQDSEFSKSIFELPYDNISDVSNTEFTLREKKNGIIVSDENKIQISDLNARFFDESENSYIVTDINGNIVPIESVLISGSNNSTVTLTINEDTPQQYIDGDQMDVLLSYKRKLIHATKSRTEFNEVFAANTLTSNFTDLAKFDVLSVDTAIYTDVSDSNNPVEYDITNDIVIDNGQRDGIYKKSKIRYTGSVDLSNGDVSVKYHYFLRSSGDFYSRNSYSVDYEDIPSYNDTRLSDVLDFRPDDGATGIAFIDPNSVVEATVSYYLNRIDKVIVDNLGEFRVIAGTPALNPNEPETPENSMHLYTVDVPAFTFDIRDINSRYVDNRGYTMRDIGEIEQRVKNIEYQMTLSLLEKEASGKQIFDTDALYERFKNGVIVDSFNGHTVGDIDDAGYLCSMDPEEGILRPLFDQANTRFILQDEFSSYGGIASLDYGDNEIPFIEQLKASTHMSVNPYAVAAWWGEVKLSPSSDEWKETSQRPDVVINRENDPDVLRSIADATKAQGTRWNSWRTQWVGRSRWGWGRRYWRGRWYNGRGRYRRNRWWRRWHLHRASQTREGVRTTASIETVRNVINEKVVDTSVVPFIRSRRVYFQGKMFRPNTKMYIYFDGVDISKYATLADFKQYSGNRDIQTFLDKEPTTIFQQLEDSDSPSTGLPPRQEIITDIHGNIEGFFVIPNNAAHKFRTGERKVVFTDSDENDSTEATTSATADYSATGVMQHMQKTVVSTRKVKLTEERVTQRRNIWRWNTWYYRHRRYRHRYNRYGRYYGYYYNQNWRRRCWRDPLAQSFMIGEIESGLYATSLDLYFRNKSANVPLQMYIVTTDNGYPSQEQVPGSEVTLLPEEVDVSEDASLPTKFRFETPIYLKPGVEYAIVVLSNDDAYRMWLSDIGKDDVLTGEYIAKNPYTGVMFKSQNASTWTADQNKDFKFAFYRARYPVDTPRELIFDTFGIGDGLDSPPDPNSNGPLSYSQLSVLSESITLPETSINYQLSTDGGNSYYDITTDEDIYRSSGNTSVTSDNDIKLKATLSSDSEYVTPTIDLDRTSLISIKNLITTETDLLNDDSPVGIDGELSPTHGSAVARYLTREVELNKPADQLNIYLNIIRPIEGSNIKVYARFKTGEEDIKNLDYIEISPKKVIPIGGEDFEEILFESASNLDSYQSFQVKIVLVSNEHENVPTVKDFRAIATT
jgi:hypothetical protein